MKTSSLGDVVHQLPAVSDAARARPDAAIAWVVEEAFAPLARLHPAVREVIPVATRRWRAALASPATWREIAALRRRLSDARSDVVIDTQGLIRSGLIARLAPGARHGYDAKSIREPLASRCYDVTHRVGRDLHAVTRNRLLTAAALGYAVAGPVDYGVERAFAPAGDRYALLFHGTSRTEKEWAEPAWIETGRWLRSRGVGVLIPWGNDAEKARAQRLATAIDGSRVLERQPLDRMAQTIAGAALVAGVDTGLLHLAAAYRVPLAAIFVSTDPGLTGPVGQGAIRVLGGKTGAPAAADAIAALGDLIRD